MTFVTVYEFKIWNDEAGAFVVQARMGTRAAIQTAGGEIIEESAREVPAADLDSRGFTRSPPAN